MPLTNDQRDKVIEFCKKFIDKNGSVRVGWAIEQIMGEDFRPPTHLREKIANTIIQTGEYTKEKAAKKYDDWNIYKTPGFNKFSKIDKLNLTLGIISIVGVIVSICISVWSINVGERIAEKSGAFDKGELQLSFGGYFIQPDVAFDVYYGVDFSDSTVLHFATLPFSIHNLGKKTIENANIIIKYPHVAKIAVVDSLIKFSALSTEPIERKFATVEPYDQVIFKLNSLNPKYSIEAGELICLQKETILNDVFPVKTKDSATVNVSVSAKYSYPIVVGLTAKDIMTSQYNFILNYRKETDLNKLINDIIKEKLSQKDKSKLTKQFFVIIPTQTELNGSNLKLALMNSNSN